MGQALYVERETVPSVIPGEEIMMIVRDKGSETAPATLFIVGLEPNTTFETDSGQGTMVGSTPTAGGVTLERGQRARVIFSNTEDEKVYTLRCLTGRLAATIVSAHPVKMEFRTRGQAA